MLWLKTKIIILFIGKYRNKSGYNFTALVIKNQSSIIENQSHCHDWDIQENKSISRDCRKTDDSSVSLWTGKKRKNVIAKKGVMTIQMAHNGSS